MSPRNVEDDWENMSARGKSKGSILPLSPLREILQAAGGEGKKAIRAGDSAAKPFRNAVEMMAKMLAKRSAALAKHANRETIKDVDVDMAAKEMLDRL
jgi:histone H3/H4